MVAMAEDVVSGGFYDGSIGAEDAGREYSDNEAVWEDRLGSHGE